MFHKFIHIFIDYYCRKCGAHLGSTDNGSGTNRSMLCSDCARS